ncbi:hypothetical protein EMN47_05135 [Prolixibacteraceae bacterium JC049]|nr:hypothetical protein [Prolixibacteraceae bacterium JC049]
MEWQSDNMREYQDYRKGCREVAKEDVPVFDAMKKVKAHKRRRLVQLSVAASLVGVSLFIVSLVNKPMSSENTMADLTQKEEDAIYALSVFSNQLNNAMSKLNVTVLEDIPSQNSIHESFFKELEKLNKIEL